MANNQVIDIKDFITEESVKEVAKQLEANSKQTPVIDAMMGVLIKPGEAFGESEIAAILALPDDKFNLIKDDFLFLLDESLNNPNDRMVLQRAMDEAGITPNDFTSLENDLLEEVDDKFGEIYSKNKIDFLKRMFLTTFNIMKEAYGQKRIIKIPIELCHPDAKLPTYAHDTDAAMDLYAIKDYTVGPGETVLVKTGIKTAIPQGYALLIQPRSGQSLKTKLRVANTPGLIDAGYRDEIGIIIENLEPRIADVGFEMKGDKPIVESISYGKAYTIEKGQRIAQMRLVEAPKVAWQYVDDIGQIEGDRKGGFGSSGLK